MKKILLDDEIFTLQDRYGGISRLYADYINYFKKDKEIKFYLPFILSNNVHLNKTLFRKNEFLPNIKTNLIKTKMIKIINNFFLKKFIMNNNYDCLHLTYMNKNIINLNNRPLITTIHDLIPEIKKKFFSNINYFINLKYFLINKSSKIITVSNTSKKDMLNFYKVAEKKIKVIYPTLFNYQLRKKEILIPKNFLLYVGHRNGYKNFKVLLKSFVNIHKKYDLYLICVGGEILTNFEKKQLSDLKVTDKIIFVSLTDEELNYCYSKALCFIYPSLYEGFGKTILEAAINNCITICSDIPAFKETAGDSVLYFNPNNSDQLQHSIINIIEGKIENLRNKMYKNLKRFSYIKSKNKLKDIYLNI